jgi:hypothetical protein
MGSAPLQPMSSIATTCQSKGFTDCGKLDANYRTCAIYNTLSENNDGSYEGGQKACR